MVDATRRKLTIPNWYSPYLEKHRIYELFHELARELVIQQPPDHILFLKEVLSNAAHSRHAPRIVFLASPYVNTCDIASLLAEKCGATVVVESDILSMSPKRHDSKSRPKVKTMVKCLNEALRINNIYRTGWILPDFPKSRKEAKRMQQVGILPTHVLQFLPEFSSTIYDLNKGKYSENWMEYRRTILGIRDAFNHNLKEVYTGNKSLAEVVDSCLELIHIKKRHKTPIIPRICLIGPKGSGRKTQAKLLAETFHFVHVDFEYLLCQACMSESHLGHLLRHYKDKPDISSVLLTAVVHKRILEEDCLQQGWLLTGFPNTLDDMKNLDMLDTPPNRVIFLEIDTATCMQRLVNRKTNIYSGSVVDILQNPLRAWDTSLETHPKDMEDIVIRQLKQYDRKYKAIKQYCASTATFVDASQNIHWLLEILTAIIMRPLPDCEPRCPSEAIDQQSEVSSSKDTDECICYCIEGE